MVVPMAVTCHEHRFTCDNRTYDLTAFAEFGQRHATSPRSPTRIAYQQELTHQIGQTRATPCATRRPRTCQIRGGPRRRTITTGLTWKRPLERCQPDGRLNPMTVPTGVSD
jgi:hypothetical protein